MACEVSMNNIADCHNGFISMKTSRRQHSSHGFGCWKLPGVSGRRVADGRDAPVSTGNDAAACQSNRSSAPVLRSAVARWQSQYGHQRELSWQQLQQGVGR